jgi:hypothetical protein
LSDKVSIIRITLRSQPSKAVTASGHDAPVDVRLANLLKFAGRSCGFKCVNIEKIEDASKAKESS